MMRNGYLVEVTLLSQEATDVYVSYSLVMHWNSPRAKIQLKIAIQRLKTLQEKKQSLAKQSRREIALFIEKGKMETARIKTESIINEDIYTELLELLELYCEVLSARFGLLDLQTKEPDPAVAEAVNAVIYAAARTEVKELHVLREMLMYKYGREFSIRIMDNQDGCVAERIVRKLVVETPSEELVNGYLAEIARGYKVEWAPPLGESDGEGGSKEKEQDRAKGSQTVKGEEQSVVAVAVAEVVDSGGAKEEKEEDEFVALSRRFEALKSRK